MSAPTDHTKQADFIRLWNTADSLDELSVRLNRSVTALKQRAARLSAHYTLRSFPGARRPPRAPVDDEDRRPEPFGDWAQGRYPATLRQCGGRPGEPCSNPVVPPGEQCGLCRGTTRLLRPRRDRPLPGAAD